MDYSIIRPQPGYLAIKEVEEKNKGGLQTAGKGEANAYANIVAIGTGSKFEIGQLVVYNEFEGQELFKVGKITEEGIIIIKEEEILATIL